MANTTVNTFPREFTTLIKRLEAATSRLEDLAEARSVPLASAATVLAAPSAAPAPPPPPAPPKLDAPKPIAAFDELILDGKLPPFLKVSEELGDGVWAVAQAFGSLLEDNRDLIVLAAYNKKPAGNKLNDVFTPLSNGMMAAKKIAGESKGKPLLDHVLGVDQGIDVFAWVTYDSKPAPYVAEIRDSTQFYTNRVLKNFKDKEPIHKEWVKAFSELLEELRKYVQEYHTTGLAWNIKGGDYATFTPPPEAMRASAGAVGSVPPPPPPPPGGMPPPPPPPPPGTLASTSPPAAAKPAAADPGAVFAQLNVGESVTKGLKKVTADQQTHKNPSLRGGGTVPDKAAPAPAAPAHGRPAKPTKPRTLAAKKPAKMELEGKKWIIEYQENENSLVIENGEMGQVINLFACKNSVLQIKGKVNAITMVNCEKTSILCESVVASVGITSSKSFALQITGTAPTIMLDSVDSGQIYLSKDCLGVEIVSAKCSAINVSIPEEGAEEGVFKELAMPEQLRTTVSGGRLVTTVVEHVG
ncbi:hypothetical protein DACRYDRAFT_92799 [Dacryopinax primogenitus]|uniref:Adenylyl cyclase-associated protein n=1 Tax=Dacryopinax primogenitus (strain DJM 731) TaxID=1858805 RepID=M5G5I9_DACPD|nr:uncharacterized protein DACRYDRAFT_92799 [Dacryopinax primogenitus]EJU05526.1 hypothetical protein DACRYDRAFT_92799 [Dacryopinax primogenitus]